MWAVQGCHVRGGLTYEQCLLHLDASHSDIRRRLDIYSVAWKFWISDLRIHKQEVELGEKLDRSENEAVKIWCWNVNTVRPM